MHAESERLKASLVETACELTQLQRESDMLREERERLTERLARSEDNNRSLEGSLSSTQEEIDRLEEVIISIGNSRSPISRLLHPSLDC